jgi:hypothetical protein
MLWKHDMNGLISRFIARAPPLPGMVGFLMEFLWLFVPIFAISTACSWLFYRNTSSIGLDVIFNALIFAWVAAVVFPF